jgi:hypothetical protein
MEDTDLLAFTFSDENEDEAPNIDEEIHHRHNTEFYDDNFRLIIDKNQIELNEVQEFFKKLQNHLLHTKKGIVSKNFWTLICCTIGDNINSKRKMTEADIFKTCASTFVSASQCLLQKAHLHESIFKYCAPARYFSVTIS